MSTSAGRVLLIAQGTYDESTTYSAMDMVYYSGSTYVAKSTTVGNLPTDTTYWQILAEGTDTAVAGSYYGECSTAAATTAKTATISNYSILAGQVVTIKFTYAVPASSTLNISSVGALDMYSCGSALVGGEIAAGDTAVFVCDGTTYHLITVDRLVPDVVEAQENISGLQGSVATIETTSTASQDYAVDEYLYYNNQLYKVTTAITSGDTLVVDTNIEATTVGGELEQINSDLSVSSGTVTVDTTYLGSVAVISAYSVGGIKFLYANINFSNAPSTTEFTIATLPSEFCPTMKVYYTMCDQSGKPYLVQIYTDGTVSLYANGHTPSAMLRFCYAYPVI